MSKTATLIMTINDEPGRHAAVYKLSEPLLGWETYDEKVDQTKHSIVVVSAVTTIQVDGQGPETYIFGADESGKITDWCELPGSMKGTLEHCEALRNAGYEIDAACACGEK